MEIACIGWGSLIWSPRELPRRGEWHADGPLLPVEFSRVSADGRVTLALTPDVPLSRSLWTLLDCDSLDDAARALARREQMPDADRDRPEHVGIWTRAAGHAGGLGGARVAAFAELLALDAVLWTDLPCGLRESRGRVPSPAELVDHVRSLDADASARAEEYVRNTPPQVDTPMRRHLESVFGWYPAGTHPGAES